MHMEGLLRRKKEGIGNSGWKWLFNRFPDSWLPAGGPQNEKDVRENPGKPLAAATGIEATGSIRLQTP